MHILTLCVSVIRYVVSAISEELASIHDISSFCPDENYLSSLERGKTFYTYLCFGSIHNVKSLLPSQDTVFIVILVMMEPGLQAIQPSAFPGPFNRIFETGTCPAWHSNANDFPGAELFRCT